MGIYRTICYKVEDLFVKAISRKQDQATVKVKVNNFRSKKEKISQQRKVVKEIN